jgi:hypothetical protein
MAAQPNVFLRLHKWATHQDENYCTEALAVLLETLLARQPEVGVRLVAKLTENKVVLDAAHADSITFVTQPQYKDGRPDLEIRAADTVVLIEVKVEEALRPGQLAGYRQLLARSGVTVRSLGVLTRYTVTYFVTGDDADFERRWHEVADWIEEETRSGSLTDPVSHHLCGEFLSFLRARGMALAQVDWQFAGGVRAMQHMIDMMLEAARSCGVTPTVHPFADSMGIDLFKGRCWIGFWYSEPENIYFECYSDFDAAIAKELGYEVVPSTYSKAVDKIKCAKIVDLSDERVYFFARSKVGQLEHLIGLFKGFLADVDRFSTLGPEARRSNAPE